ncbi:hypothetical protein O5O45_00520 [Hahella aquimaris]|uniref:hypothetical protein n=1 Tax=Hahella sp. HNIBRBA332 TaxID=3015983 RepID=UPI00273ADA01|nr:hypothetical protein [Hahella sp. HNIBRBA332]WLQ14418.1 hypothetical protein O5O45_00520 [Hahella sp. HNIBRBA332]
MERKPPKHNGHVIAWLKHQVKGGKGRRWLKDRNEPRKQIEKEKADNQPVNKSDSKK